MSLFRPSQETMEILEQAQGLDPNEPNRRNRSEKKRTSMIRTYEEPLYPKLSRILFFSMIAVTAVTTAVEISSYVRYTSHLGVGHFLRNLATTGSAVWGVYSLLLVISCVLGIRANAKAFRSRQRASGTEDRTEEDRQRSARAIRRLNASYWLYLKVALPIMTAWLVFYLSVFFYLQ